MCKIFGNESRFAQIKQMLELVEENLLHPHDWVRICCSQIFGFLFNNWTPKELIEKCEFSYLSSDLTVRLRQLSIKFCGQLRSESVHQHLSLQIVKNLLYVIKSLYLLQENKESDDIENKGDDVKQILQLVASCVKYEISYNRHCADKRSIVIKLCSAVAISMPTATEYLELIVEPIFRECERPDGKNFILVVSYRN